MRLRVIAAAWIGRAGGGGAICFFFFVFFHFFVNFPNLFLYL